MKQRQTNICRKADRGRQNETQRQTNTCRKADRGRQNETQRQTNTCRKADRGRQNETQRQTNICRKADRGRQNETQRQTYICRKADRGRQNETQRQTDRQTDTESRTPYRGRLHVCMLQSINMHVRSYNSRKLSLSPSMHTTPEQDTLQKRVREGGGWG